MSMTKDTIRDDQPGMPAETAEQVGFLGFLNRFLASKLTWFGLFLIFCFIVMAIAAPWIAPYNPVEQSLLNMNAAPSSDYWFGADGFGRDVLSRVIWGARPSMVLAMTAPVIACIAGTLVGTLAGFYQGWVDRIVGRITDMLISFPSLLLGILVAAALGPGFSNVIAAVAFAFFPRFIRVARASTMAVRNEPYIEAAFAVGQPSFVIILRHVLPNISGPIIVVATLWIATAIRIEATLSFLGLGVQAPDPSWGNIIRDGLGGLLSSPWPVITAGLAVTLCVLAFNIVGDAIRDALDPEHHE
ncbi:MAG: ABC transporter permease [Rhodospirillales bacterium]